MPAHPLPNVGFPFPLLKYFIGFPIDFGFLDFEYLKRPKIVFMFPLRVRKEQVISYEWLLFKSEPVKVNLARASGQEFSGLVLYNFEVLLTCSDEL